MTSATGDLAAFLDYLQGIPDSKDRIDAFGGAVIERGGAMDLPVPGQNWGPHRVELSLMGVQGTGDDADEALADWIKCARRQAENIALVIAAEELVMRPPRDASARDLSRACEMVRNYPRDGRPEEVNHRARQLATAIDMGQVA